MQARSIGIAGVLAICFVTTLSIVLATSDDVTKSNFDRIPPKATKSVVLNILGDPNNTRGPKRIVIFPPLPELPPGCIEMRWRAHEGVGIFHFDEQDVVIHKAWYDSGEITLREIIRRWLHRWVCLPG